MRKDPDPLIGADLFSPQCCGISFYIVLTAAQDQNIEEESLVKELLSFSSVTASKIEGLWRAAG
jgi:hypothetical protein